MTTSISEAKLAANRANAAHSTGPTSDDGKAKSSQNATKHGLTGNIVVLPTEDMNEFQRFSAEIVADLEPEAALERELAQTVANFLWRLKRIKPIEEGLLNADPFGPPDPPDTVPDCKALARSFMEHGRSFANLSSYEHRLYRNMKDALKQFQTLKASREEREQKALALETARYYREDFPHPPGYRAAKLAEAAAIADKESTPREPLVTHSDNGQACALAALSPQNANQRREPLVDSTTDGQALSPAAPGQRRERLVSGFVFPINEIPPSDLPKLTPEQDETVAA